MRVILASGSPRRKELLSYITKDYEIMKSDVDETFEEGLSLEEQSKRLAYIKAKKVFEQTEGDRIVIGSDTFVVMNNKVYGKPKDKKEAFQMLSELQGNTNQVLTSLCVLYKGKKGYEENKDITITNITIKPMSAEEINYWIDSGESIDKAGAYAVQGKFSVFIDKIEGSYAATMGLPIHQLYPILKKYIN